MSGKLHPPLLTPAQATSLLEQVMYEQVLECVDLHALYRLERSLTLMIGELEGVPGDHVCDVATAMLDRALLRLPGDLRGYLQAAGWAASGGCELCEEEKPRPGKQASGKQGATRLKS